MAQLELFFLGAPIIKLNGAVAEAGRRKALALLAYLAATGESHRREKLATLLWPDYDSAASFAYLRRALWELNQALGEGWIEAGRDTVRLVEGGLWVDLHEYRQHLEHSSCHSDRLAPACQQELSAAVALYRGDFLAGFSLPDSSTFDDWQFFQAEELRRGLAGALESLALGGANRGEFEAAVTFARRWLSLDPLHEPAHRLLMQIYAWMGQRSAALRQYEAAVQVLKSELGVEPQPETIALYERIRSRSTAGQPEALAPSGRVRPLRAGVSSVTPSGGGGRLPTVSPSGDGGGLRESWGTRLLNFPTTLTPFVGRRVELDEIARLLEDPEKRLVTLLGPGGIGKTRLAIQAALEQAARPKPLYPDGVAFVALSSLAEAENIVPAIARALGLSFLDEGPEARRQLVDYLRSKRMLLVLDNYEHLIDESSARLPAEILGTALGVEILITSRASLNVQGEQLYPVSGMGTPAGSASLDDPAEYSAILLFDQSARRVQPGFHLDAASLPQVVRICQMVAGMPLGIELAAAWLDLLPLEGIVTEIRRNLDFLETHLRDVPERQRSLRAVFDASWQLLNPQEQEAFRKLSVFAGGFTRLAAQAIVGASLHTLAGLVSKSLVQRVGNDRYAVHDLLRQYATEKLQAELEAWDAVRDAHSAYYFRFLAKQGEAMKGPSQKEAIRAIGVELDNIRAAAGWALVARQWKRLEQGLYGLILYLMSQFLYAEAEAFLDDAIATVDEPGAGREGRLLLAKLLALHATLSYDLVSSRPVQSIQRALAILEELRSQPDPANPEGPDLEQEFGMFASLLGSSYGYRIEPLEGIRMLRQSIELLRAASGKLWEVAYSLQILGDLLHLVGEREQARQTLVESAAIFEQLGDRQGRANTTALLARLESSEGHYPEALRLYTEIREIFLDMGDPGDAMFVQYELGRISMATGAYQQAADYFREGRQTLAVMGALNYVASMMSWESIATVRLGDYEAARRLREESLRISTAGGDKTGIVWSYWELGDIERLEGHFEQALRDYQESLRLFEENKLVNVYTFYYRGLGDLARARGDQAGASEDKTGAQAAYAEARQLYEKSLALSREEYNFWNTAYNLTALAKLDLEEGDPETARSRLGEALEKAGGVGDLGMILIILAGAAALFAARGERERAAGLAAYIYNHPAAWRETRTQVEALLDPGGKKQAVERNLEEVVKEVREEL